MRMLRFGVPSQGFEDLHRPFSQLSAIWPAILCATVVVRRAVSKQRLPTGLWTLSRLLIRAKVWNAPFTLGSTQQGLSPPVCGWEVCLFRKYALQPAGLLRIPCQVLQAGRSVLGLLSAVGEWLIHVYATSIRMCLLPHTVITLCSPFMLLLLLSALYSVQLQLYNVYSIGVPSCFVLTAV